MFIGPQLSPYQLEGANFLVKRRFALLADEPGLGKTAQAVTACDAVNAKTILVICPAVARINWKREFAMWSRENREFKVCENGYHYPGSFSIVSYDYATKNVDRLRRWLWDVVICDESHFIKEPTAKRTQATYGKNGIIRSAHRWWNLSGTPAPNHAAELWPMLYTFGTTSLPYDGYVEKYCKFKYYRRNGKLEKQILGTKDGMAPEVKSLLAPIMLRRKKNAIELPPIMFEEVVVPANTVPLFPQDEQKIEAEKKLVEKQLERGEILQNIADSVPTLRRQLGLQKIVSVADLVENELQSKAYEKVIIFAVHREVIERLKDYLGKFNPVVINGATAPKDRQAAIDSFQNDPFTRIFIGNIQSAGTAITLTAAHQVIMLEQSWTPADNAQAVCRAHRRGQDHPVFVRTIMIEDSLDQKITSTLRRKTQDITAIIETKGEENA